ncbi:ankyrin repeat domain-containing protein [Planctomycetota bacterium]
MVHNLIQAGANVHVKNHFDQTPLHYAVTYEHLSVIELLLKAEADPNERMNDGRNSFDLAKEIRNDSILSMLKRPLQEK